MDWRGLVSRGGGERGEDTADNALDLRPQHVPVHVALRRAAPSCRSRRAAARSIPHEAEHVLAYSCSRDSL